MPLNLYLLIGIIPSILIEKIRNFFFSNNEENKEKLEKNDMILLNSFNFVIICTNEFNTNIAHLQDLLTFFCKYNFALTQKIFNINSKRI